MLDSGNIGVLAGEGILPEKTIWTPEIEDLNGFIVESVGMQCRGCAVIGKQCNGKTFATEYLMGLLPETLGHAVGITRWTIPAPARKEKRTTASFLQQCMLQSGCTAISARDVSRLWLRLAQHLAELAAAAGSRWIIVIIDEAQNLTFDDYQNLIHVGNTLQFLQIKSFFLLVGQPELANVSASWNEADGKQLIGRFFARQHKFRGLKLEYIAEVLECFDERTGIGAPRPSAKLMPQVLGTEWHMGHWGPQFCDALHTLRAMHNITYGLRVPMQMLRSALLLTLNRIRAQKLDPRRVSSAMVLQALQDTGFAAMLVYYAETDDALSDGGTDLELAAA